MICNYTIFCEETTFSSNQQVSAKGFFSRLTLDAPGTTTFSILIGVSGIKKATISSLELIIDTPDKKGYSAKWKSPLSEDEHEVYNASFNCSKIPLNAEGLYSFKVFELNNNDRIEISKRYLRVSFNNGKTGTGDNADG